MTVKEKTPVFGQNYNIGYIGFSYSGDFWSGGIAYFTRWARLSEIRVDHAFVVTGKDTCVEAIYGSGVVENNLFDRYFNNRKKMVFFRKPLFWNEDVGTIIASTAKLQIGNGYDIKAILCHAFSGSLLGRLFCADRWLTPRLSSKKRFICSELAAISLLSIPQFKDLGVLINDPSSIDPQELFEDNKIFEPWNRK